MQLPNSHTAERTPLARPPEDPRSWPPAVRDWEAFKAMRGLITNPSECVPESFLRKTIARQFGIDPKDVTMTQIRHAGADMCRHYGRLEVVPLAQEADVPAAAVESLAAGQFWKEREDEFRKHDTGEESYISAVWFSESDTWRFFKPHDTKPPDSEMVQVFRALAREAARGLAGVRTPEPSNDWLHALRLSRSDSADQPRFAKVSEGISTYSESALNHMPQVEDLVRRFGRMEFVGQQQKDELPPAALNADVPIEMRIRVRETTETIDNVFRSSANLCLELRSRSETPALEAHSEPTPAKHGLLLQIDRWEDLEIQFVSDKRIQISCGSFSETMNFDEFGFGNKKSELPVLAWRVLELLAKNGGKIQAAASLKDWRATEKRIQEIRSSFRKKFGLSEDPFRFSKKTRRTPNTYGYSAIFKIGCRRSYES